jgi:hypothetical protein
MLSFAERVSKICAGFTQYLACADLRFIGLTQLTYLTFKLLNPLTLVAVESIAASTILLSLPNPEPQCLGDATNLGGNGHYRGRMRFVRTLMLQHHANGSRPQFR